MNINVICSISLARQLGMCICVKMHNYIEQGSADCIHGLDLCLSDLQIGTCPIIVVFNLLQ